MSNVFVIGDLHFGHKNIHKLRPQFESEEHHAEHIIERWNSVVNKRDTVWILGDACFSSDSLQQFKRMKGNKNLVLGNHDLDAKCFIPYFGKICGLTKYRKSWLSHSPIHPDELRGLINIHGHTHFHVIPDSRYVNVCCEQVNYTPIPLHDILIRGN